jgi:hypothetical protein
MRRLYGVAYRLYNIPVEKFIFARNKKDVLRFLGHTHGKENVSDVTIGRRFRRKTRQTGMYEGVKSNTHHFTECDLNSNMDFRKRQKIDVTA